MIARGLIIGFKVAFCAGMFGELARHIDMFILLGGELLAAGEQLAAQLQRLVEMNAALVGMAHVIRRHVVGGFGDQMLEQIAVRLGHADRFQRHAVFTQRRFHILERLAHAAVFRQQIVAKRAGNGAGDTAVERGFNQAIIFAAIGRRTQTTRHHAQIEHQRVVIGDGVELLELHPFHRVDFIFELVEAQHARLTIVQGLGEQLCRQYGARQALNSERFDVHFTVAPGDLLQTHAHQHALMARVHDIQHRITDARFEFAVQALIARATGRARFGGVAEMQKRKVRDKRRDKRRHCRRFPGAVTAGKRGDQLVEIKRAGKKAVPVDKR
ncbi:hypothetical protein BN133_131 [Cronobacter dublinensis 582]|nr:hypothetical protein BN133_131 [Cronobacter dublinensis 582]